MDAAKYVVETDQPYLNSIVVMSKKWLDGLPPDLQKIVRDDAATVSNDIVPFVEEFFAAQRTRYGPTHGGESDQPSGRRTGRRLMTKISSVGLDLSASKPDLNAAVKIVFASAARNK